MIHLHPRAVTLLLGFLVAGCSGSSSSRGGVRSAGTTTSSVTTASPVTTPLGTTPLGTTPLGTTPPGTTPLSPILTRGQAWVRSNPMFVSGLSVGVTAPSAAEAAEYYDVFNATAVHLWMSGLPAEANGWQAAGHLKNRFVSWVDSDGTSRSGGLLIGGYSANQPGRIGYQVGDEPRSMSDLLQIEAGMTAIRTVDPDALLIVNFSYLANDIDRQLDYYVRNMDGDVLSYDAYSPGWKAYGRLNKFRLAALRKGVPYWRYMFSFRRVRGSSPPEPEDMRWDAFAGLVYGYTGHSWFLYQVALSNPDLLPAFFAGRAAGFAESKTALWHAAAQINSELNVLGRSITQLTSTDVRYVPGAIGVLPPSTRGWLAGAGGDRYLKTVGASGGDAQVGVFRDDGDDRYLMIQNTNHPGATWPVGNTNSVTITLSFDFSSAPAALDRSRLETLNKLNGQVESVALTPVTPDTARLTLTLSAGDAVFVKYATGRPFAMQ